MWGDLTAGPTARALSEGTPLLTGTDGTCLQQCSRETDAGPDDVHGDAIARVLRVRSVR